jgi:hypothetical protein
MVKEKIETVLTLKEFYAILDRCDRAIDVVAEIKAILEPEED